jgi:endonuclease III
MTKQERAGEILQILKSLFLDSQTELSYTEPYQLMFAVIMSAQTTDKQVNTVTPGLFVKYPTLQSIAAANLDEFTQDISRIGLYRGKAKNIIASAKKLCDEYEGVIPKTIAELIEFPGVARKTANVVLSEIYGINEGIAVDTHVMRLSQLLGLTTHTEPVAIERDLMKLFVQEDWRTVSHGLILYGRRYWSAREKTHTGPLSQYIDKAALKKWFSV